jgi:6-pyruvoyltetrahydropterin/6-carboxytetrahydropterin synthase
MLQIATIELFKEEMKFSAGHFTIFSATKRENMHGHNYQVSVALIAQVVELGLAFDYRFYKDKIKVLCRQLNGFFLLPAHSKFLKVEEKENEVHAIFNEEKLSFLKRDVLVLPLNNITVEELSRWFLSQLLFDVIELKKHAIQEILVKVSSSPGQLGSARWVNTSSETSDTEIKK